MGRSLKKGPFVNAKLLRTIEEMMVKTIDHIPADGWTYHRSA